jgi:hypothetical protein
LTGQAALAQEGTRSVHPSEGRPGKGAGHLWPFPGSAHIQKRDSSGAGTQATGRLRSTGSQPVSAPEESRAVAACLSASAQAQSCGRREIAPLSRGHGALAHCSSSSLVPAAPRLDPARRLWRTTGFFWRSSVRTGVRSPLRTAVRSGGEIAGRSCSPIPAPFAGLTACRHLYATSKGCGHRARSGQMARIRRDLDPLGAGEAATPIHHLDDHRLGGGDLMGRRRNAHRQGQRPRGCAHSARVLAVERQEADLDRFVAALLVLAAAPGSEDRPRKEKSPSR